VGETLHVVGHVRGEFDNRLAEAGLALDAAALEARVDEGGEVGRVDLLEAHHRTGLVKRPPRA
jgi:hypothetical protein